MEELRHNLPVRRSTSRTRSGRAGFLTPPLRQSRLAEFLVEARHNKGLELRDLAVITDIRMSHLEALEAGDYQRLPKDAQGKAVIRLYAKSVGLDPARMLLIYAQERRGVYTATPAALELPHDDSPTWQPFWNRLGRSLATLALIAATLGGSLWAFNTMLFSPVGVLPQETEALGTLPLDLSTAEVPVRPSPTSSMSDTRERSEASVAAEAETPAQSAEGLETAEPDAAVLPPDVAPPTSPATVPVTPSETTSPTTAQITVQNPTPPPTTASTAPAGTVARTPQGGAERTTGSDLPPPAASPTGQAELSGDAPDAQQPVNQPTQALDVASEAAITPDSAAEVTPEVAPDVTVQVSEAAWLEVYAGGARGEGDRLLYRIAEAGERFSFARPVYVYTGNAGGVSVGLEGGPAETLGIRGAVIGRSFAE